MKDLIKGEWPSIAPAWLKKLALNWKDVVGHPNDSPEDVAEVEYELFLIHYLTARENDSIELGTSDTCTEEIGGDSGLSRALCGPEECCNFHFESKKNWQVINYYKRIVI